jgi:tetratricopeptide (TPR) repeat protein
MKKITFIILLALAHAGTLQAQKRIFTREYSYQASEDDSRNSARANATTQMRNVLLREIGEFLRTERVLIQNATTQDYSEKIEAITAGIVEMKTLDERWDGATYYIKAEMAVDPKDLERRITEVLNDKQKTQELEEARKRVLAAEAEAARLKKELEESRNEQQRLALQTKYRQTADVLSAEEYYTKGNNARDNGFHERAIEYYQQAIGIDPNHVKAYNSMGNAYDDLENYQEAIRCFQKAVNIDPNYAFPYNNMGITYYNLKNYLEAIRCYQKAVNIDPNYAEPYNNMGNAYDALENHREAIRYYKKAVAIKPNYSDAYYNMGTTYRDLGNRTEYIKNFQQAARLGDKDAQKWLVLNGYKW